MTHTQSCYLHFGGVIEGYRHDMWVHAIRTRNQAEDQRKVVYATGQRTDVCEELRRSLIIDDVPGARDPSGRWFEAGDPAKVSGQTDARAGVAADIQRRTAGRYDRRRATARTA